MLLHCVCDLKHVLNMGFFQLRTQDFRKGGPGNSENLRITKTRMKNFPPRISPFAYPKSGEDKQTKKRSSLKCSPVFGPKLGEDQKINKKRSSLKFSPVFGLNLGEGQKKGLRPPFLCSNLLPKLQRGGGGGMLQFCILFYANCTILATQRGHWLNAPSKWTFSYL